MSQDGSHKSIFGRGRTVPSVSSEQSEGSVSRPGPSTSSVPFGRGSGLRSAPESTSSSSGEPSSAPAPSFGRGTRSEGSSRASGVTSLPSSSSGDSGSSRAQRLAALLRRQSLSSSEGAGKNVPAPVDTTVHRMGSSGEKVTLLANWVRIGLSPDKEVFQYDVKFEPTTDNRNVKGKILATMEDVTGPIKSFDGAILWLPVKLSKSKITSVRENPITKTETQVTITYQKRTDMQKCIHLYNVLFTKCAKILGMSMVQRNYYLPGQAIEMKQHDIEIWPGYVFAAHAQEGGCMLNIDASHKVLRMTTVYEVMSDHAKTVKHDFKGSLKKELIGSIILTRYNSRTYRVDDVDFTKNPMSTFINSKGREITYKDYYKETYNFEIHDLKQPLLVHKQKDRDIDPSKPQGFRTIHLIPEKSYMTGLTDKMRQDYKVMKDLAQHTRLTPYQRCQYVDKFISNLNQNRQCVQALADWGITLLDHQIDLEGRVIRSQAVVGGRGDYVPEVKADWGRETCKSEVLKPVNVDNWIIVYHRRNSQCVHAFVDTYMNVVRSLNIRVTKPKFCELQNDSPRDFIKAIEESHKSDLQLAVIVFPFQREDRYNGVKNLACAHLGLPTQCIVSKTIMNDRKLRSITQKIALQINCKLGGELWGVKIPIQGLMICGVDVYHDPSRKNRSVVAFVSSMNNQCSRWSSHVSFQGHGEEIINGMVVALHRAILAYFKVNHSYPSSILVYRDGVGDGMFDVTKSFEIPQLATVFNNIPDYQPKFYYVIVQKRINTRLIKMQRGGSYDNPEPGTVMDHTITKNKYYDFLLVSQLVRQGTVTPTHYVVLEDGGLEVDKMQILTYKMTHMYYNWPGTIRVPAPCQYAHKLAYLIGENVKELPKTTLENSLFFL